MAEVKVRSAPAYALVAGAHRVDVRNTPVYALVVEPGQGTVRNVMAYVLTEVMPEVAVRATHAYVLTSLQASPYVRMEGLAAIKAAVLAEQQVVLDDICTVGEPTAQAGYHDTTVLLTALETADFGGTFLLQYARFAIDEVFLGANLSVVPAGGATIHSRLAAINAANNCEIAARDVVDGPADDAGFTLTAASTSYLFAPGSVVKFGP